MLRRQFIHRATVAMVIGAAGSALPRLVHALDSWKEAFATALEREPWLLAFRSVEREAYNAPATVEGTMPEGLEGTLFRNGPARHEIGEFRYHHWFDGDGMLQAWRIGPGGIRHEARMIATRKYLAELDAGRALYRGFATIPPNPKPVTSPDLINVANISVLAHHGELYALWEAGSPWSMNAETLETKGLHRFSPETEGLPFSAHPRVEPDGTLWNFGYVSSARKLVLWHISKAGKLVKAGLVDCDPISAPHDFLVTERHIVLLIPPLHFEPEGPGAFLDAHKWHPDRPTRVLVVDKNDFSNHRSMELPAQWIFHYGNAWEDSDGIIRFDAARAPDPGVMLKGFRTIMRGEVSDDSRETQHYQYRIDLKRSSVTETPLLDASTASEFPVIDPRVSGRRYSKIVMLTGQGETDHSMLNEVSRFDFDSGKLETYRYPNGVIPEEHIYVPEQSRRPEQGGWIVGSALNYREERSELRVFRAEALADGPVVTAALPYALPLGLHAKFV